MSAILDIPEVRQRISRLSVDDYHRLGEFNAKSRRTELIRGIVIEKMSKSPLHRTVVSRLYRLFLAKLPEGYCVWKEEPLSLADSEPEPDVSIVRGTESDFRTKHPATADLVVEVAISNPNLDRENASLYAEAGVREYWIILGVERQIEVFSEPVAGRYQQKRMFGVDDILSCGVLSDLQIRVSDLFA